MAPRSGRILAVGSEVLLLTLVVGFMSATFFRNHEHSIWMDVEFSGWVAPVANRLAEGISLYGPGGHIPLPPLPFILMYVVSGGHATWLTESVMIVAFQSALVLILYFGLVRQLPRPVPVVASLLAVPCYFGCVKTIFYDACTQALVALTAIVFAGTMRRIGETPISARRRWAEMVFVGALAAATMLSKQSTGVGMVMGLLVSLFLGMRGETIRSRVQNAVVFGLATVGCCLIYPLLAWQHLSLKGMFVDIFLTGAEPKGGAPLLLTTAWGFSKTVVETVLPALVYGVALTAFACRRGEGIAPGTSDQGHSGSVEPFSLASVLLSYTVVLAAPWWFGVFSGRVPDQATYLDNLLKSLRIPVLWSGLIFVSLLVLREAFGRNQTGGDRATGRLAILCPIFLGAAFFNSLSVDTFRWFVDNNPLITLVLAGFLCGVMRLLVNGSGRVSWRAEMVFVVLLVPVSGSLWQSVVSRVFLGHFCTVEWPEVRHLAGARMTVRGAEMRRLVADVRHAAPDAARDEVLLLPNDPNVEAWFERPRPKLSSAIIFSDQYWDRYVDRDFQTLTRSMPKVIVIGPRNYWRPFQHHWNQNRGCERLIDLVRNQLLPDHYLLQLARPIPFWLPPTQEFMDVYVRNDGPPFLTAVHPQPSTSVRASECRSVAVAFGYPIDPESVNATAIQILRPRADGGWEQVPPATPAGTKLSASGDRASVDIATPLAAGRYLVRVDDSLRDRDGRRRPDAFYSPFEVVADP